MIEGVGGIVGVIEGVGGGVLVTVGVGVGVGFGFEHPATSSVIAATANTLFSFMDSLSDDFVSVVSAWLITVSSNKFVL